MTPAPLAPTLNRQTWQIISTPAWSGEQNMRFDRDTLLEVQNGGSPTLRFFRWSEPTVSYGKHQSVEPILRLIPPDWPAVQRPTGGGIVYHGNDLCVSLCWRSGQPPLPQSVKEHYQWVHRVIAQAVSSLIEARLASCQDCSTTPEPFATRDCFTQPVGYDVLRGHQKIVGGALCRQKNAFLYQGSIQSIASPNLEQSLKHAFNLALNA